MTPEQEQLRTAYRTVFATHDGKIVLEDLKRFTTYRKSSWQGQTSTELNVNKLIIDEAQRTLLLYILDKIKPIENKPTQRNATNG